MHTQIELTKRCIEILAIPQNKKCLILDIGCGSGLSGSVISEYGHTWIGLDISKSMLNIAKVHEVEGDLIQSDIGQGFGFRPGTFDYAISVSAIQWLCIAEKRAYEPYKRLKCFFASLFNCLVIGARVCLQFYPDNAEQIKMITDSALESGFSGGVVVDYPHSTKAKKYFLFLQAGYTSESIQEVMETIPKREGNEDDDDDEFENEEKVDYLQKRKRNKRAMRKKPGYKTKNWIKDKKERQRRQGRDVRPDTKFTGRRRKMKGI